MQGFDDRTDRNPVDVDVTASTQTGVWLVDSVTPDDDDSPFMLVMGARTPEDAARAYVRRRTIIDGTPMPYQRFAVFPLVSISPVLSHELVRFDSRPDWSAFQDAFIPVRL